MSQALILKILKESPNNWLDARDLEKVSQLNRRTIHRLLKQIRKWAFNDIYENVEYRQVIEFNGKYGVRRYKYIWRNKNEE